VVGFRGIDFSILEYSFNRFTMNLIRISGSDVRFSKFLRLVKHHVAHFQIVIGIATFAQNGFPDIENFIQLEFYVPLINP